MSDRETDSQLCRVRHGRPPPPQGPDKGFRGGGYGTAFGPTTGRNSDPMPNMTTPQRARRLPRSAEIRRAIVHQAGQLRESRLLRRVALPSSHEPSWLFPDHDPRKLPFARRRTGATESNTAATFQESRFRTATTAPRSLRFCTGPPPHRSTAEHDSSPHGDSVKLSSICESERNSPDRPPAGFAFLS